MARYATALVFLGALCFYAPQSRHGMLTEDEGWLLDSAMRVASGQVPHRDFASIYPAGRYYLAAGVLEIAGQDVGALRLSWAVLRAAAVALTFDLGRRLMPWPFAMGAAITVLLAPGAWHKTAMVLVPLVGLWCFAGWLRARKARWLVLMGLVAGLGAFVRQDQAVIFFLAASLAIVVTEQYERPGWRVPLARLSVLTGAAIAGALPCVLALHFSGALQPALSQLIHDAVVSRGTAGATLGTGGLELRFLPWLAFGLALVGLWRALEERRPLLLCLAVVAFFGASQVTRSPILVRFLQQGALYALLWFVLAATLFASKRRLLRAASVASCLGPLALVTHVCAGVPDRGFALEYLGSPRLFFARNTPFEVRGAGLYGAPEFAAVTPLVEHVRGATAAGEPVLSLCRLSSLYFLADRPNPTHRTRLDLENRLPEELAALGSEVRASGCRVVVATQSSWERAREFCQDHVGRQLAAGPRFGPYVVAELRP